MKVKEESEKVGLKLNMQKTKIMASHPVTLWQISVLIFNISQNDLVFFHITPIKPKRRGYMIGESVYILFWTWPSLHGK